MSKVLLSAIETAGVDMHIHKIKHIQKPTSLHIQKPTSLLFEISSHDHRNYLNFIHTYT